MNWETVMGLEVHCELSTKTKIFCGCSTAFGAEPNTQVCPGCSGMPGTLPRINKSVIDYALRLGLALNCNIAEKCMFDRKHYFYPDLPNAFQISQLYAPICRGGYLEIEAEGKKKKIGIKQIHMEEDAGKLVHGINETYMDFNRSGIPLLEIVSDPDFRNSSEVIAYLEKLRETIMYLEISNCKMEEGSFRADINLSVRRPGEGLGVRVEMKNINSFKAIIRAIEYERERQIDVLEEGGSLVQETRRWSDEEGRSFSMRSKENAQDYRYIPDPDLLPVIINTEWLNSVRENLPELAWQKRERYVRDYSIPESEAAVITSHIKLAAVFENLAGKTGTDIAGTDKAGKNETENTGKAFAKEAAHLVTGEIMRLMNTSNTEIENLSIDTTKLSFLISQVLTGKINRAAYKETIEAVFYHDTDPEKYIAEKGLAMLDDDDEVTRAVEEIINENEDSVSDYRAGKEKVFGFLMGSVMKKLKGKGNPETVKKILEEHLR